MLVLVAKKRLKRIGWMDVCFGMCHVQARENFIEGIRLKGKLKKNERRPGLCCFCWHPENRSNGS